MINKLSTHVPILDSLRAFAAISVCLYHFICTTTNYIQSEWVLYTCSFGRFGVQLFFVISGFIIPYSMHKSGYLPKNFFTFLLKRLLRLEPPYLISLIMIIGVMLLRKLLTGASGDTQSLSVTRVALHFGYLIPFVKGYTWVNYVYWTLAVEFQYYLLMALLFFPLITVKITGRIAIYLSFFALSFFFREDLLPYSLPIFLLGILLFLVKASKISYIEYYIVTAVTLLFAAYRYELGLLFYVTLPIIMILYFSNLDFKLGNFLGKMSYSIYLFHLIIGSTFINLLSHYLTHPLGKFVCMFSGLAITIISSMIIFRFIEKPSKQLSSKIKYKPLNHYQ